MASEKLVEAWERDGMRTETRGPDASGWYTTSFVPVTDEARAAVDRWTALMNAIPEDIMRQKGRHNTGVSLLWYAAEAGYASTVRLLLEHGADGTRARDSSYAMTYPGEADMVFAPPLIEAVSRGHAEVASVLLEWGVSANTTYKGRSALRLASDRGHSECVRVLEAAGARL